MGVRSEQLLREQAALLAEIDAAFADVNRDGGVSWSEAHVIDDRGSEAERLEARGGDKDQHWNELVAGKNWDPNYGVGGWSFLDPIGFRYYLPVGMKLCIASGVDEGIQYYLTYCDGELGEWKMNKLSLLDDRQRRCVARFVRFMVDVTRQEEWGDVNLEEWQQTLEGGWLTYTPAQE